MAMAPFFAKMAAAFASTPPLSVDHLVYVVPDLEQAVREFEDRTGVRPRPGGRHLGLGTHNAFLALGEGRYLELFAPDPEREVDVANIIGVDGPKPRLATFCCRIRGIEGLIERFRTLAEHEALLPRTAVPGTRTNEADGSTVSWVAATDSHEVPSEDLPMGGLLPFYIDWGDSIEKGVHPSVTAPPGCTLKKFEAFHPNPEDLRNAVRSIGSGLEDLMVLKEGKSPKLVATLDTPNGIIELS